MRARSCSSSGYLGGELVQLADQLELVRLLGGQHVLGRDAERQRVGRIERELHARVPRAEVVGVEVLLDAAVVELAQEHELRQVLVERAQAVMDPRAEHRLRLVERVAAVVHLELGGVVVVGRVHRPDDRHVVDARRQVRQPVADFDARTAPCF